MAVPEVSQQLVARTRATLQTFHQAFMSRNQAALEITEALKNDEILKYGNISTGYNDDRCRAWRGFCLHYGLTENQANRFKGYLTPLSGILTPAIDFEGFHVILGDFPEPGCDDDGWLLKIDFLMGDDDLDLSNLLHRTWTLCALYLARHPQYPSPAFMIVD